MSFVDSDETQLSKEADAEDLSDFHYKFTQESSRSLSIHPNNESVHNWRFHAEHSEQFQIHLYKRPGQATTPFTFFKVPEGGAETIQTWNVPSHDCALSVRLCTNISHLYLQTEYTPHVP